jgi:hypothetical protein
MKKGVVMKYNVKSTLILAAGVLIAALINLTYSCIRRMPIGDAVILLCISVVVFLVDLALCVKDDNFKK